VSRTPIKKLPASASVGLTRIPVTDRRSEKVDVGFSDFGPARAINSGIQAFEARVTIENSALGVTFRIIWRRSVNIIWRTEDRWGRSFLNGKNALL
jgi:hypothetical protein